MTGERTADAALLKEALNDWTRDNREWKVSPRAAYEALERLASVEEHGVSAEAWARSNRIIRDKADERDALVARNQQLQEALAAAAACAILEHDPARTDEQNEELARRAQAFRAALASVRARTP